MESLSRSTNIVAVALDFIRHGKLSFLGSESAMIIFLLHCQLSRQNAHERHQSEQGLEFVINSYDEVQMDGER